MVDFFYPKYLIPHRSSKNSTLKVIYSININNKILDIVEDL